MLRTTTRTAAAALVTMVAATASVLASSHSDAPLIKQDPQANLTDVYAFVGTRYDDPGQEVLNVVVAVRPFSEPGDGPHYDRFADDARYSIHLTNPSTGETFLRYDFFFSAPDGGLKNQGTILSYGLGTDVGAITTVGDARQNFTQSYSVQKATGDRSERGVGLPMGNNLLVAPPNPGRNVTPAYNDADGRAVSGAASFEALDDLTKQSIYDLQDGTAVFAGPRDDGFYADIPGIFNLLDARILSNDGNGVDGFKGFNVLVYALQIPLEELPALEYQSVFFGKQLGVGVYASVSRPRVRIIGADGERISRGRWVQVNRLANPVFNEALVALADKDRYNQTSPTTDEQFAIYAQEPELAMLINFVFQTDIAETARADLVNIYIPDVLRVNTTTGPVPLSGQEGFNRLGFLGGDLTAGVTSGWPNGRRLGDDVIDIALTAIASGPTFASISPLGDNLNGNDLPYNQVFPYAATPHAGAFNRKDPVPGTAPASIGAPTTDLNRDGVIDNLDMLILLNSFGTTEDE